MSELAEYIRKLRKEENVPLFFRRQWVGNGKAIWYIWYGDVLIAYRVNDKIANHVVSAAAAVHWAAKEASANKIKAA